MIRFAYNLAKNRVFIENATDTDAYYCEECGASLIPKNHGLIKSHHFAHKLSATATSFQRECSKRNSGYTEMSEWHKRWQDRFPLDVQERVIKNERGEICRADIYLEEEKTVIEFQHSKLPVEDFHRRNRFYNDLGLKVIWLFDFDYFISGKFRWIPPNNYDDFTEKQILVAKERYGYKADVYGIDKSTYLSMFGEWKPQENKMVEIHFVQEAKGYVFYKKVTMVSGNFKSSYKSMQIFAKQSDIEKIGTRKS